MCIYLECCISGNESNQGIVNVRIAPPKGSRQSTQPLIDQLLGYMPGSLSTQFAFSKQETLLICINSVF